MNTSGPYLLLKSPRLLLVLITLAVAIPSDASEQKKVSCSDGDHYTIDWQQIAIKYDSPSFTATLHGLFGLDGKISLNPEQLQKATERTQQLDEYLKGIVAGYNGCAITKQQYFEAMNRIFPDLKNSVSDLENARRRVVRHVKVDAKGVQKSLQTYSADLGNLLTLSGVLTPANDPDPPTPCAIPPPSGALKACLGGSLGWTSRDEMLVLNFRGQGLVSMERTRDGQLAVSAEVSSSDGRVVAQIVRNRFAVNPNNYFRVERPDSHTLAVYDQQDQEVLNVRFLNRLAVRITGEFGASGSAPVVVNETQIRTPSGSIISGDCFGNFFTGIQIQ